tara:strand:+ start:5644 stop:6570 length:927 start_codon:yes stop_codon:yes gene_type:complete
MARAAKDAGLTMNGTEAELFKMMEQGKVLAKDILPAFAKQLRQTAHDGGALTHALDNNLSVAIGKATFNLQQMSNAIFTGGLKDALKLVLDNFNLLAPKTKDLAFLLGKTLGGAVTAVTMPFVLFGAALADVWTLTKKITGVNDEMGKSLLALVAKVAGLVLGFKALFSAMKKVAKITGFIKDTAKVASAVGATTTATTAASTGGGIAARLAATAASAPAAGLLALGSAKKYDASNPMFTPMNFNMPTRNNPYNSSFQPKDVNVKVKVDIDEQGNWKGAVQNIADNAVMDAEDQRIQQALNSFHGGGY